MFNNINLLNTQNYSLENPLKGKIQTNISESFNNLNSKDQMSNFIINDNLEDKNNLY